MSKPRIRVWTSGLEFDAAIRGTLKGACVGSGYGLCSPDLSRDTDFEYDDERERDADLARGKELFPHFKWEGK